MFIHFVWVSFTGVLSKVIEIQIGRRKQAVKTGKEFSDSPIVRKSGHANSLGTGMPKYFVCPPPKDKHPLKAQHREYRQWYCNSVVW